MFFKKMDILLGKMWMLVFDTKGNDFLKFFKSNDVKLDVSHNEIKLNNEVVNFL